VTLRCLCRSKKSGDQVKASTGFDVPYQDWGMKNPSTFLLKVENKVKIDVSAVGNIAAGGTDTISH
jgi:hypothetical protein